MRIKENIADFENLVKLYDALENILSILDLGPAGIRYFAGSVLKSRMFQLQQRAESDRYIHATAFIAHQFYRIQDHLADTLLKVMASFKTSASREHKDRLAEKRIGQHKALKTAVDDLDSSVFGLIRQIRELEENNELSDTQKIIEIKSALGQQKAGAFEQLKANLETTGSDHSWYDVLKNHSLRLQNRLSPILRAYSEIQWPFIRYQARLRLEMN